MDQETFERLIVKYRTNDELRRTTIDAIASALLEKPDLSTENEEIIGELQEIVEKILHLYGAFMLKWVASLPDPTPEPKLPDPIKLRRVETVQTIMCKYDEVTDTVTILGDEGTVPKETIEMILEAKGLNKNTRVKFVPNKKH